MHRFLKSAVFSAFIACTMTANAQDYPNKTITLVVPFAAGGNNDVSGRLIAQKISETIGQSVVVENKTGAGGTIGAAAVATAKPDGYMLGFLSSGPLATSVNLYKNLSYNPLKDFVPVARTTMSPSVLVVHPSVPANTLQELVTYLKDNPGKVNYGTSGNGSSPHLAGVLFERMAGVKMTSVAYRGGNQVNTDLLGGQIQMSFSPILEVVPHIRAGKLKALAVTSETRSALLPEVPAVAEVLPGYQIITWNGIVAPAGTPKAVVAKLNAEAMRAVNSPEIKAKLLQLGLEPAPSTPDEFGLYIKSQIASFGELLKLAGVEPQ